MGQGRGRLVGAEPRRGGVDLGRGAVAALARQARPAGERLGAALAIAAVGEDHRLHGERLGAILVARGVALERVLEIGQRRAGHRRRLGEAQPGPLDQQARPLRLGRLGGEHRVDPAALRDRIAGGALEQGAGGVAGDLARARRGEPVGAAQVGERAGRVADAVEQPGSLERERGGAAEHPLAVGAVTRSRRRLVGDRAAERLLGGSDQREDRGVELGRGAVRIGVVVAVEVGEHRVGDRRGLGGAPGRLGERGARPVVIAERERGVGQLERGLGVLVGGEPGGEDALPQPGGGGGIAAARPGSRRAADHVEVVGARLERGGPRRVGAGVGEPVEQHRPLRPGRSLGAAIAALAGEPGDVLERGGRVGGVAGGLGERGERLVDRDVVGRQLAGALELGARAAPVAEPGRQDLGEPDVVLDRAAAIGGRGEPGAMQADQIVPAALLAVALGERLDRLGVAGVVAEGELVERGRVARIEDAEQARRGERGERGGVVVAEVGAGLGEQAEVVGGVARVPLRKRDRGERRVRGPVVGPAGERLAGQLEAVDEPGRARRRDRKDAGEQHRLIGAASGEQRAVAAHRLVELAAPQRLVGGVHRVVGEDQRGGVGGRLAGRRLVEHAVPGRRVRHRQPGAGDPRRDQLDAGDRGQPPAARRQEPPEEGGQGIELDVAQAAHPRQPGVGGGGLRGALGGADDGREDPVGEHRAGRRQVAVDADVGGDDADAEAARRAQDPERQVGGGEAVGDARGDRDAAVGAIRHAARGVGALPLGRADQDPRGQAGDPVQRERRRRGGDPRLDRARIDAERGEDELGAPALVALGGHAGIERRAFALRDLELEPVDVDPAEHGLAGQGQTPGAADPAELERQPGGSARMIAAHGARHRALS